MINEEILQDLKLPEGDIGGERLVQPRKAMINEAISWEEGQDETNKRYTELYSYGDFTIKLGKPGKEVFRDDNPNKNDMTPTLFKGREPHENKFSFDSIFELFTKPATTNPCGLELLGCIFFRMAYLFDHKDIGEGKYELRLPKRIEEKIKEDIPCVSDIPTLAFIYMLEAIALQEDVKYWTLGKNENYKQSAGRVSNLSTYCYVIAFLLGRVTFAKVAGSFGRPPSGIAKISHTEARRCFPFLVGEPEYIEEA